MKGAFEEAARWVMEQAMKGEKLPPSESKEYVIFQCIEDYVESNQDIHGRREYKVGDLEGVLKSTVDAGDMMYVLMPKYWVATGEVVKK